VEEDVAADPRDVRLLRAAAVVAGADRFADAVEEPWLRFTGLVGLPDGERRDTRDVHDGRAPHRAVPLNGDHIPRPPPAGNDDTPSVRAGQSGPAALVPSSARYVPAGARPSRVWCNAELPSSAPPECHRNDTSGPKPALRRRAPRPRKGSGRRRTRATRLPGPAPRSSGSRSSRSAAAEQVEPEDEDQRQWPLSPFFRPVAVQ
jgi:hypothetical protein